MEFKKVYIIPLMLLAILASVFGAGYIQESSILNIVTPKLNISTPDASLKLYAKEHDLFGNENGESIELRQIEGYPEAKPYIGWYTYDNASDSVRGTAWMGAHYLSMTATPNDHSHWSVETLDNNSGTPLINTKFEIKYGSDLDKTNPDLYAKFSGLYSVNFGQDVRLLFQGGAIKNNGTMLIYPDSNNFGTKAVSMSIVADEPTLTATDGNVLGINDDLRFISASDDILHNYELDIYPNAQTDRAFRIEDVSSNIRISSAGGNVIEIADDIRLIGSSSDILHDDVLDIYPNNQASIGLSITNTSTELQISAAGASILRVNDDLKVVPLGGTGDAYVCVNNVGLMYRSSTACN